DKVIPIIVRELTLEYANQDSAKTPSPKNTVHTSPGDPATSQKKENEEPNVDLKQDKNQVDPEVTVQVLAGNITGPGQMDPQKTPIIETPDAAIIPNVEPQILQQ
ncbi:hypothetical protein A2U01_0068909, partial [Trifolium medium]|nr:hypothetical protein [Trifolium medium]